MNKALWDILLSPATLILVAAACVAVFVFMDWLLKKL